MYPKGTAIDMGPGAPTYEADPFVRHARFCLLCRSYGGQKQCETRKAMTRDFERNGWEGKRYEVGETSAPVAVPWPGDERGES
jgi:hypothetical protein